MSRELRRARADELPAVREVFALAFEADPMFRFLLPDDATRLPWLRVIMGALLASTAPDDFVFTVGEGVPAAISLSPPGKYPPPARRLLAHALRPGTWAAGLPSVQLARRGLALMSLMDELHEKRPHHYVHVLGVHPDHQGTGLGKALLDPTVARSDDEGMVTYLETSNPKNLAFYRRFGFDVTKEVSLPGGFPPLWAMTREPGRR